MKHLHEAIAEKVAGWRVEGYPHPDYPAVAEILEYAWVDAEQCELRYLRSAQFRALETYWYLRLVSETPRIPELYEVLFPRSSERREALGLSADALRDLVEDEGWEALYERIRTDNDFVRAHKLESLRETLTLDYPSYILALAMGAGKTILMGTIVATEFAMAQEYPEADFVRNALIFAPGKTIVESLREIADMPFERILPPRMYKPFAASLKLTFTRDGEKDIPIVRGSSWNVVVTNTEKIRIQKPTSRRGGAQRLLGLHSEEDPAEEIANLRLQAIASLPHLAVFSDEAHHTYGQKLLGKWQKGEFVAQGIKKVRRTVDYLAANTNLVVAVNTTGTPYFKRQPLKDVVIWYGLGEGIRDGVLKEVAHNIRVFDLDEGRSADLVREVMDDFIKDYWATKLPDGSPARIALYFPNTASVAELRPEIEAAIAARGLDAAVVLEVNNKSPDRVKTEFYRVAGDPASPFRVLLLVNMGTEGWNCPSLFACALVRKLKSSNNFVLQAASRCLRQVPGNTRPARIYLAASNRRPLENQLRETYGTGIQALDERETDRIEEEIRLRQPQPPPILIKRKVLRFRRRETKGEAAPLTLEKPEIEFGGGGTLESWRIVEGDRGARLQRASDIREVGAGPELYGSYSAAAWFAANYHLPTIEVHDALIGAYGANDIPEHHLEELGKQIEEKCSNYETYEESVEVAVALVKPEGFDHAREGGEEIYTARVSFAKDRAHLYKKPEDFNRAEAALAREKSFHYEGYNFDSEPEAQYLSDLLAVLAENADRIEGVWFTGGLTDPAKTDLYAEYQGEDGRWHRYTPDFVIRRADGKHLIVEIKKDVLRPAIQEDLRRDAQGEKPITVEGRKAVALKSWETLNPERLRYEVLFADAVPLPADALRATRDFLAQAKQDKTAQGA